MINWKKRRGERDVLGLRGPIRPTEKAATEEPQPNEGDLPMNDQLIPLSHLSLDLDAPASGWPAYLVGRGVPILEDDIGRPAIAHADARQLFEERAQSEVLRREVAARNDAQIEARRLASTRPGWPLPP